MGEFRESAPLEPSLLAPSDLPFEPTPVEGGDAIGTDLVESSPLDAFVSSTPAPVVSQAPQPVVFPEFK